MIRLYIRIVGGTINVLEQVLFWLSMGRFLKSKIINGDLDSNPLVIVDVGINRGQSTILFLKWVPNARIRGFEQLRHLFAFTEIRLANRARLYNLGARSNSGVQRS